MKRFAPLFAIIVLIGILGLLNKGMNKSAGVEEDTPPPPPPPVAKTATQTASDPLPPELTLGNPATAKYKITIGWVYDSATQANPAALLQIVESFRHRVGDSGGTISAEFVNLDMPASELSPLASTVTGLGVAVNGEAGATVDGKEITLAGNPGEGAIEGTNIAAVIDAVRSAKP